MVDIEYANAYSEVVEILNHIPKSDYDKIPNNMIELFNINKNKKYSFSYDVNKTLDEQNVSKKAKTIIAILFRDYWATSAQREKILAKEKYDLAKLEEEKREHYNPDNIFKKKKKNEEENIVNLDECRSIIEYKENNFFKKIIKKLTKLLHIK